MDFVYPVGSYYMTNDASFNPNTQFPGTTWVKLEGAFLYAAESSGTYTVGQTGGDKNSVAKHTHKTDGSGKNMAYFVSNTGGTVGGNGGWYSENCISYSTGLKTSETGIDDGNMPPWKAVIMWERTV